MPRSCPPPERPLPRPHTALALAAALLLALGGAACASDGDDGGSDGGGGDGARAGAETTDRQPPARDAYLEALNAAQTRFAANASSLDLSDPSSARAFGRSLGRLEGFVQDLADRLRDIAPPDAVASEHDELIDELTDYRDAIAAERGDLSSGDRDKIRAAAGKIGKASGDFSEDFEATIRQINRNLGVRERSGG